MKPNFSLLITDSFVFVSTTHFPMSFIGMDSQAFLAFLFTVLYFIEFIAYNIKVCMIILNDALSLIQK